MTLTEYQLKATHKGFSLVELIIGVAIFSLIVGAITLMFRDTFFLQRFIASGLQSQYEARKILRPFANEVRGASLSSLGSYPIVQASSSSFIFYSDIDSDGLKERVRYYKQGTDFLKGVIKPSGTPLVYAVNSEVTTQIVRNVISTSTPVFTYYSTDYDGVSSTTPLVQPVIPNDVRLIKVTLVVDDNIKLPPASLILTTQVSFRNLKDNL